MMSAAEQKESAPVGIVGAGMAGVSLQFTYTELAFRCVSRGERSLAVECGRITSMAFSSIAAFRSISCL